MRCGALPVESHADILPSEHLQAALRVSRRPTSESSESPTHLRALRVSDLPPSPPAGPSGRTHRGAGSAVAPSGPGLQGTGRLGAGARISGPGRKPVTGQHNPRPPSACKRAAEGCTAADSETSLVMQPSARPSVLVTPASGACSGGFRGRRTRSTGPGQAAAESRRSEPRLRARFGPARPIHSRGSSLRRSPESRGSRSLAGTTGSVVKSVGALFRRIQTDFDSVQRLRAEIN